MNTQTRLVFKQRLTKDLGHHITVKLDRKLVATIGWDDNFMGRPAYAEITFKKDGKRERFNGTNVIEEAKQFLIEDQNRRDRLSAMNEEEFLEEIKKYHFGLR